MSEESTPPPSLRLKPRIRPDAVGAPPPPVPKVAAPLEADGVLASSSGSIAIPPATEGEPKLKRFSVPAAVHSPGPALKRLPLSIAPLAEPSPTPQSEFSETPAAVDEDQAAPEVEVASPEEENVESAPTESLEESAEDAPLPSLDVPTRFSVPPPSEDGVDVGRFKLKPRLSTPDNAPPPPGISLPTPLPGSGHAAPPPGIKIVATAPSALPSIGSIPKVGLQPRSPSAGGKQLRRVVVKSGRSRKLKFVLISLGVIVGGALAVGGFIGFRYVSQLEKHAPAPEVVLHIPVKKPVHARPVAVETEPDDDAPKVAPSASKATHPLPKDVPDATGPAGTAETTAHAANPAVAGQEPGKVGPSKLDPNAHVAVVPQVKKIIPPSAEFRALIINLRVNGVFQGDHPRALLNGRLMSAGEVLDPTLQIRFTGIDAIHKQLLFEDGFGSLMQRHY